MSDVDRLRAAAVEADRTAVYLHGTGTPTMHATAALLRAVADESEVCWCGPEYTERNLSRPGCPAHDVMIASRDAALALADAILGIGS